jgi:hypothetical protein
MKTLITVAALAAATLAATGAANAQPRGGNGFNGGGGSSITLYDLPNYQGGSRTYNSSVNNLNDIGMNDRAQSARVQGRWRICQDASLRGRCAEINGDQPNLATIGMTAAISSFESLDRQRGRDDRGGGYNNGGNNGGFNGGRDDRGPPGYDNRDFAGPSTEGRTASFFPRPTPGPYRNGDEFCRRLGFNGVIYADDRGGALRDVLCRR